LPTYADGQATRASEKLRLIRILVDELDSSHETVLALEAGHAYPMHTPLAQYGVAESLLAAFPDLYISGPEASTTG
jgi:hypothetical protein